MPSVFRFIGKSSLYRFLLSIAAVVIVFSMVTPAAFAVSYFTPAPLFPTAEDLPFGYNSVVVEVKYNSTTWYRFYLPNNALYYLSKPGQMHTNATLVIMLPEILGEGGTPTVNRFFYHTHDANYNWTSLDTAYATTEITSNYLMYELQLTSYITANTYVFQSNYSSYYYDNSWVATLRAYPSDTARVVSEVDRAATSLAANMESQHRSEMTQESRNHAQDMTQRSVQHSEDVSQRSAQHSEIMHAGEDQASLDTNNNWMDDSLSKVNGWLDDVSGFESQMAANRAENAENMSKAGAFLDSFFGALPAAIIAAMSLCLVMIVVVKIVGR